MASIKDVDEPTGEHEFENKLMDIGFMFDAHIQKATRKFTFGDRVIVDVSYVEQEPGAVQVSAYPALHSFLTFVIIIYSLGTMYGLLHLDYVNI